MTIPLILLLVVLGVITLLCFIEAKSMWPHTRQVIEAVIFYAIITSVVLLAFGLGMRHKEARPIQWNAEARSGE